MLKNKLMKEIEKWTRKLDNRLPNLKAIDDSGEDLMENARAYRRDSEHFLKKNEPIKSYESLIWAWAFIEIGEELGHIEHIKEE